ncbi:choice-of-anchor P family protein [uncultured Nocardioides sp.]|uniref:choice-of-anchor P family protein n=1 Tax=uncultured Nocardioides sp. TaxID=198441 RepID=UPI0026268A15|nr:choice-of-anchor P family protein [uncultured Nocardioides sp.]
MSPTTPRHPSSPSLLRTATGTLAALALGLSATVALAPAGSAAAPDSTTAQSAERATLTRTPFAFRANGYGTSASGGMIPVGSDRTALSSIACTSDAGKARRNFVAESEVPGLGTVRGVYSRVSTSQKKGVTTSSSIHRVAEIVLADTPLGSLTIDGVESTTSAFHDSEGFHATAQSDIAGISFTPPGGEPQSLDIPSADQPITIPGVAVIELGRTIEKETKDDARAYAVGLVIKVIPTETTVKVARSVSKLEKGYKSGIFHGSGVPAKAKVLGELVEVGKVINQVMPCTGTDGELDPMDAADVDLAEQVVVEGASARQKGKQTKRKAVGMEASQVAELNLADQLVIEAINSKVNVTRLANGKLKRNAKASFGAITLGGEPQSLDQLGELEIPGLAKIQTGLQKKIKGGIRMIGVRVTLLDGTGAVLDFATSKLSISES